MAEEGGGVIFAPDVSVEEGGGGSCVAGHAHAQQVAAAPPPSKYLQLIFGCCLLPEKLAGIVRRITVT